MIYNWRDKRTIRRPAFVKVYHNMDLKTSKLAKLIKPVADKSKFIDKLFVVELHYLEGKIVPP
jgi:hypothetical protein